MVPTNTIFEQLMPLLQTCTTIQRRMEEIHLPLWKRVTSCPGQTQGLTCVDRFEDYIYPVGMLRLLQQCFAPSSLVVHFPSVPASEPVQAPYLEPGMIPRNVSAPDSVPLIDGAFGTKICGH